jgi:3-oxoacyl-[acyl-carrier protein] reductase
MRLKDKVAIITGAGRGIGRATALRFAEEGACLAVTDIELEMAQAVVTEILAMTQAKKNGNGNAGTGNGAKAAPQAIALQVNVVDQFSVNAMVGQVIEQFGRVDILVNNAGIVRDAQIARMSEEDFDKVIDVNLKGVFNCTQAVVPIMSEQKQGVILSTASVVATYGNFGQTNYVASKAGVIGMTKVWARELGRKGIRVNAVAPGFIQTRLTEGIPNKVMDKLIQHIPLGYMGSPEHIANAFLWLASDEAAYVSGHTLAVDGGTVI